MYKYAWPTSIKRFFRFVFPLPCIVNFVLVIPVFPVSDYGDYWVCTSESEINNQDSSLLNGIAQLHVDKISSKFSQESTSLAPPRDRMPSRKLMADVCNDWRVYITYLLTKTWMKIAPLSNIYLCPFFHRPNWHILMFEFYHHATG